MFACRGCAWGRGAPGLLQAVSFGHRRVTSGVSRVLLPAGEMVSARREAGQMGTSKLRHHLLELVHELCGCTGGFFPSLEETELSNFSIHVISDLIKLRGTGFTDLDLHQLLKTPP